MAYCYQCYECGDTLYADALSDEDNGYEYIMNGEICSSCQEAQDDDYYDD